MCAGNERHCLLGRCTGRSSLFTATMLRGAPRAARQIRRAAPKCLRADTEEPRTDRDPKEACEAPPAKGLDPIGALFASTPRSGDASPECSGRVDPSRATVHCSTRIEGEVALGKIREERIFSGEREAHHGGGSRPRDSVEQRSARPKASFHRNDGCSRKP
jgi:hypothetical protein